MNLVINYSEDSFGSLPHSEISAIVQDNKYIFESPVVNSNDRYVGNVYAATSESICSLEELQQQLELLLGSTVTIELI